MMQTERGRDFTQSEARDVEACKMAVAILERARDEIWQLGSVNNPPNTWNIHYVTPEDAVGVLEDAMDELETTIAAYNEAAESYDPAEAALDALRQRQDAERDC